MSDRAPGRHVLITGTSTGIGRATAERLARSGWGVLAGVRRAADAPEGTVAVPLDVTDADSVAAMADAVADACGDDGLAALVNNAGVCVVGPVECVPLADWRRQFEVNLFGGIAVTQAMLPLLRRRVRRGGGRSARIVNISSVTGQVASPLFAAYSASKHATEAVTDALRLELAGHGIGVSVINPGTIATDIWRKERAQVEACGPGTPARRLYGTLIDNVARYVFAAAEKSIPPDRIAVAVERCLTARRPPVRVRVGWESHVGCHARRLLPERLFDHLMSRSLGVPGYRADDGKHDGKPGPMSIAHPHRADA
jgi:NAD(P)-dependent dehydrogenase (short-subunit alcohol dehydrogenase family)